LIKLRSVKFILSVFQYQRDDGAGGGRSDRRRNSGRKKEETGSKESGVAQADKPRGGKEDKTGSGRPASGEDRKRNDGEKSGARSGGARARDDRAPKNRDAKEDPATRNRYRSGNKDRNSEDPHKRKEGDADPGKPGQPRDRFYESAEDFTDKRFSSNFELI
jgi:hypothetical protein